MPETAAEWALACAKWLLLLLPAALYLLYVVRYSVDVPIEDDYFVFVAPIIKWLHSHTLLERLSILISQNNEHRPALARLVALFEYYITGRVNFAFLSALGNVIWLLAVALVAMVLARRLSLSLIEALPIPFLLLNFEQNHTMFFATNGLQWGLSFLIAFLFLASLLQRRIIYGCLLLFVGVFTSGNTLLLVPIGVGYLLLRGRRIDAAVLGACGVLAGAAFFYQWHSLPGVPPFSPILDFTTTVTFLFAFLGGAFQSASLAPALGMLVAVFLIYVMLHPDVDDFVSLSAAWLLATALLAALGRSWLGWTAGIQSRYAPFSLFALVLIYVWLLRTGGALARGSTLRRDTVLVTSLLSIAFFAGMLMQFEVTRSFAKTFQGKVNGQFALAASGQASDLAMFPGYQDLAKGWLLSADQLGFYDYHAVLATRSVPPIVQIPSAGGTFAGTVEAFDGSHISGWAVVKGLPSAQSHIHILLQGSNSVFEIQPFAIKRSDVTQYLGGGSYDYSGYEAYLGAYAIPAGTYRIGVLVTNGSESALTWSDKEFTVPSLGELLK